MEEPRHTSSPSPCTPRPHCEGEGGERRPSGGEVEGGPGGRLPEKRGDEQITTFFPRPLFEHRQPHFLKLINFR